MINDVLRDHVRRGGEVLEGLLKRIIRQELQREGARTSARQFR